MSDETSILYYSTDPPPATGWKLKVHSFSSLWILFPGRTKGVVLYSWDWTHAKAHSRDQRLGIRRFERWLMKPENSKFVKARIYHINTSKVIHEYKNGIKIS